MPSEITLKTVLCFWSICMALGRPPFPLNSGDLNFPPSGLHSHSQKLRVPPYMMQLYQTLMGEHKDPHRPENQILEESDTVQSLPAKSCTVEDNRWSITFDLTPITTGDDLRLVELRVLLPPFKTPTKITMEIFHTENGQGRVFLGSVIRNMPVSHHSAWKSFNVTNMMGQHLQWGNKKTDHAIGKPHGAAVPHSERPEKSIKDDVKVQKTSTNRAIVVFFSKDKPSSRPRSPGLIKKLSESSPRMDGFRRQRRNRNNRQIITPTNNYAVPEEEQAPLCRKVDMMVDFKELGWDSWVIYPKKYNAYRCEGSCQIPLKDTAKTTNYDYIKSFINLKEWERSECSSCVPVKMRPLSMLFHEEPDLVLRHHEDMIIEECGAL
ncbi:PREDICTED: nodal homolog 2-A-like [Nanorana parkeri]|uniref:nodal homolog 2-A-like n=1 Tax=Nanorana parkeri TaxID=125878 RepID=UPI000853FDBC|nr:PREDICTED: nodal homolog 2-A-like [Nanorana parkeri]